MDDVIAQLDAIATAVGQAAADLRVLQTTAAPEIRDLADRLAQLADLLDPPAEEG